LENKIDALALSLNGDHGDQAVRSPGHTIPSSETGLQSSSCATSVKP
jgi:hypothetical protein